MKTTIVAALAASLAFAGSSQAAGLLFDENVTPDVIFGSGNTNGGFTVDRSNGIELGLRGKVRFDANNLPQNIFNSNGAGTYSFDPGNPPLGGGGPQTPRWSFEWSINTDFDPLDGLGFNFNALNFLLELDGDPGVGTNFSSFDPIFDTPPTGFNDHAFGTNATLNGGGTQATDATSYAALIAANNVAQNSWRYDFFTLLPTLTAFDPNADGLYTIRLSAFGDSGLLAATEINVQVGAGATVVPLPATLPLLLGALGAVAFIRRKRA